jgi:hypothetical protein
MQSDQCWSSWNRPVLRVSGETILLIVAGVYLGSLRAGHWPAGSPWSGIALGMQAVACIALADTRRRPPFSIIQFPAAALGLTGALFWMAAVFLG